MKIELEFLDALYRGKVEAQIKLEKLQEKYDDPLPHDEADRIIGLRKLSIEAQQSIVNLYNNSIRLYLSTHNYS
jgi:hypothetical protein